MYVQKMRRSWEDFAIDESSGHLPVEKNRNLGRKEKEEKIKNQAWLEKRAEDDHSETKHRMSVVCG